MTMLDDAPVREERIQPPLKRWAAPQIVAGGVLILIGTLWLLERTGAVDLTVTAVLALGTVAVGVALMALAGHGAHRGLVVFGTILALFTTVTAAAPLEGFQGGMGERMIEVTTVEDLRPNYNLAMGTLTLDLRDVDGLPEANAVAASVGMGALIIRVPADMAIEIDARAGFGEVSIFGRTVDGVGVDESFQTPGLTEGSEVLVIKAEVFMGRVEVTDR